jgi:hypothetical protein
MQKKTERLINFIPDLSIIDRAQMEAEADLDEEPTPAESSITQPRLSAGKVYIYMYQ